MADKNKTMPIVVLFGIIVLPGMVIHFDISNAASVKAIENAMLGDQMVFITAQKEDSEEEPKQEDLERVGTVSLVEQIVRLPDENLRVLVTGLERAILNGIENYDPCVSGKVKLLEDHSMDMLSDLEKSAMVRNLKELVELYYKEDNRMGEKTWSKILSIEELGKLVDEIAIAMPMNWKGKQKILNQVELAVRYEGISILLTEETQIIRIRKELQQKVKARIDKNQREYILREQLRVIREELGETNIESDGERFLEKLETIEANEEVKDCIKEEIRRFKSISLYSAENAVNRGYIETLLGLPWDKTGQDNYNIKEAEKVLNEDHYGLEKVKTRILEFLSVRALTKKGESPIICLVGPPGTGKTSIACSVAKAIKKQYVRICLGGVRDEAEIRGHRKTYVGAMSGRIAAGLKSAGVKNPLMLLDEIDKVSSDYKGDTGSALLEVLDGEQNNKFVDHYVEIPIDLSEVLFIATANSVETIPKPLLDRMEMIEVFSYTQNEKMHIGEEHLIEKQKKKNGIKESQLTISHKALDKIISSYTREAGVRNLERKIGQICRKAARKILEEEKKQIRITEKNLKEYLGTEIYTIEEANEKDDVGIVRGLAWTSVGGVTLQIEVNVMPGKGKCELTGQLGDVMKESARTGISYVRSVAEEYHIEKEFFEKKDIHIHIPEGAVPKDGPSAGITIATAVLSAIIDKKVKADVAMTGEITLRGKVLPIGGLKEKILAAKSAKIRTVLVPGRNKKNIDELEKEILDGITIHYVETMNDVLNYAFVR